MNLLHSIASSLNQSGYKINLDTCKGHFQIPASDVSVKIVPSSIPISIIKRKTKLCNRHTCIFKTFTSQCSQRQHSNYNNSATSIHLKVSFCDMQRRQLRRHDYATRQVAIAHNVNARAPSKLVHRMLFWFSGQANWCMLKFVNLYFSTCLHSVVGNAW